MGCNKLIKHNISINFIFFTLVYPSIQLSNQQEFQDLENCYFERTIPPYKEKQMEKMMRQTEIKVLKKVNDSSFTSQHMN